jgi:DNA adenine methylase
MPPRRKHATNADRQRAYRERKRNGQALRKHALGKPLLRYPGGKWCLANWIIRQFPAHRLYVEPFGGGASVLLRKPRSFSEVYNDLDGQVVNLFRVLQDRSAADDLEYRLRFTPFSRQEFEKAHTDTDDLVERARFTLIRSWMGYGSNLFRLTGFRTNVKEQRRSTPARDWKRMVDNLDAIIERLRGVHIEHRPAVDVIAGHDTDDTLFYVDPPYPLAVRNRKYYRHEMSDDDHQALAETLRAVEGMVVISGYACDLYDTELYPDWIRLERPARADGGKAAVECLWLNPAVTDVRRLPLFEALTRAEGRA